MKDGWFVSSFTHLPTKNAKCTIVDTLTAKFGQDRTRCSEMEYVAIPYSNCSQSTKDSWFVSSSTHVPTNNAKLLTPSFWGLEWVLVKGQWNSREVYIQLEECDIYCLASEREQFKISCV